MESAVLIITRRVGEIVIIGDDVSVRILATEGKYVPIGFDAPKNVAIPTSPRF
jgi:carbon storage regulator CsrA